MTGKTIVGCLVAGLALFIFGFIYWGLNPLPYTSWGELSDPADTQAKIAQLFPSSGRYGAPGPNDAELVGAGPTFMVTMDYERGAQQGITFAMGLLHNILSAALILLLVRQGATLGERVSRALLVGVIAVFILLGSDYVWWLESLAWKLHQAVYYLLYFAIAAAVLHFFIPDEPHPSRG